MRLIDGPSCSLGLVILVASLGAACSDGGSSPIAPSSGSSSGAPSSGSSSGSPQGSSSSSGAGGSSSGGASDDGPSSSGAPTSDDAASGDATGDDVSTVAMPEAGGLGFDGSFPTTIEGGANPPYTGEIPQYPDVGPTVMMNCPMDPTAGYTEYKDTFHVESPYVLPTNARFSITDGGIYNFWVFPNDAPHSANANGRAPRSEARWGQLVDAATGGNFSTGQRIWSADVLWEPSVNGSIVMQVHTTATGIGPVYMTQNGNSASPSPGAPAINGAMVPGGIVGKWFNMKVVFDAGTLSSQIFVNNCANGSVTKGTRGDGNFYFKQGVYHCRRRTSSHGFATSPY
jgi:hypothetical protein